MITKHKISPFFKTDLDDYLMCKGIDEILVGGIMTNLCVRSAVSDAYDRDLRISLLKDICVSGSKKIDAFTFSDLKRTRPEVKIVGTNEVTT